MNQTRSVADARYKRLLALLALAGGAGGELNPLPRYAFIAGDSQVAGEDGSIAEPFKTITHWTASLAPTGASVADNSTNTVGFIVPSVAGYTETVTLPAYRTVELRSDSLFVPVTGGVVWHNTAAAGGANAPALAVATIHNMGFSGGLVVTDDVVPSEIFITGDESPTPAFGGLVDLSGATDVQAVFINNQSLGAGLLSTTGSTGCAFGAFNATIVGPITCRELTTESSSLNCATIHVGALQAATFLNTFFVIASNTVITGLANSGLQFDGTSWRSFREAGGTVVTSFVLVTGGYAGGAVQGADLPTTGTNTNVSLNGTGATAGFTGANSGNWYVSTGLAADGASVTAKIGGGELPGDTMRITKTDLVAHALAVKNNAGTTLGTIPSGSRGSIEIVFGSKDAPADWSLVSGGSLAA